MVLERAREGLGRDLDNLSEEARLLREAREELARCSMLSLKHCHQSYATYIRLEDERAARLAEVAAVEADLKLLGVVVGQGEAALQATEHRAVTRSGGWIIVTNHDLMSIFRYLVFCREKERVEGLRGALGLEGVAPLGEGEEALQDLASRLGVELGAKEQRGRSRLCSYCEAKVQRGACRHCKARLKAAAT